MFKVDCKDHSNIQMPQTVSCWMGWGMAFNRLQDCEVFPFKQCDAFIKKRFDQRTKERSRLPYRSPRKKCDKCSNVVNILSKGQNIEGLFIGLKRLFIIRHSGLLIGKQNIQNMFQILDCIHEYIFGHHLCLLRLAPLNGNDRREVGPILQSKFPA